MKNVIIQTKNLHKSYLIGQIPVYALRGIDLDIYEKEFVAIMGPSGSGKSTLLHLMGSLDIPTQGQIIFKNQDLSTLSKNQLADIRLHNFGFIFQTFHLVSSLTVLENVQLPLVFSSISKKLIRQKGEDLLDLVGLKSRLDHFPSELSGGEQQRVAIARALANSPELIFADEPTGDLDSITGQQIVDLLKKLNEEGQTVCMVTHDKRIASQADRIINLFDGKIVHETIGDF